MKHTARKINEPKTQNKTQKLFATAKCEERKRKTKNETKENERRNKKQKSEKQKAKSKKENDRRGTRTPNLLIRSQTPYPVGPAGTFMDS